MSSYFTLYVVLLFIVLFSCAVISTTKHISYQEPFFVPKKIKEFYRPLHRNIRIRWENLFYGTARKIKHLLIKNSVI